MSSKEEDKGTEMVRDGQKPTPMLALSSQLGFSDQCVYCLLRHSSDILDKAFVSSLLRDGLI